jgi:hypothetical protein
MGVLSSGPLKSKGALAKSIRICRTLESRSGRISGLQFGTASGRLDKWHALWQVGMLMEEVEGDIRGESLYQSGRSRVSPVLGIATQSGSRLDGFAEED